MSAANLNTVAIDLVGQYGLAGKHLVNAYRLGTQRAVAAINERYTTMLQSPALPMVDETIRSSMLTAHQQLTGFYVGGATRVADQADVVIDKVTEGTTEGIKRLGGVGERLEAVVGTPVVEAMTSLNMPVAQLSLQIAGQVVEGSKRLVERVAGAEEAVEATIATAATDAKARAKRAGAAA